VSNDHVTYFADNSVLSADVVCLCWQLAAEGRTGADHPKPSRPGGRGQV